MVWSGSPTTARSRDSPSHNSRSRSDSGFVSWYSSTLNQRLRDRTSVAASRSRSSSSTVSTSMSSKSSRPASAFARS